MEYRKRTFRCPKCGSGGLCADIKEGPDGECVYAVCHDCSESWAERRTPEKTT